MRDQRTFDSLAASVDAERTAFASASARAAAEATQLILEEIWCSGLLAGAKLTLAEVATLVQSGTVSGALPLEHYVIVADYAAAGRFVSAAPLPGRRKIFLKMDEVVRIHGLAARREPDAGPGTWRQTTAQTLASGTVPPPAWLVPRDMALFVERVALGPAAGQHAIAWVAAAHERFARIHPFAKANGRANRLVTNLLLRRVGLPPFAVRGRAADRYAAALLRADARDPLPLAIVFARAILASLTRLNAAARTDTELRALSTFASGAERAALYKASQRGRLRTVRRGGALLTSAAWIADYEASITLRARA